MANDTGNSGPGPAQVNLPGSFPLNGHMTKGQRAMGYAMRHPKPEKGGRGKKLAVSGEFSGVPHQRVSEARAVLSYSRELAEAVIRAGREPPATEKRGRAKKPPSYEPDPMAKRETLELVRAYYKIEDVDVRKRLYELTKALGTAASRSD